MATDVCGCADGCAFDDDGDKLHVLLVVGVENVTDDVGIRLAKVGVFVVALAVVVVMVIVVMFVFVFMTEMLLCQRDESRAQAEDSCDNFLHSKFLCIW